MLVQVIFFKILFHFGQLQNYITVIIRKDLLLISFFLSKYSLCRKPNQYHAYIRSIGLKMPDGYGLGLSGADYVQRFEPLSMIGATDDKSLA